MESRHGQALLAISLIAAGVALLVVQWFDIASALWPFFIIVPGLALVGVATTSRWGTKYLAVAGAVVAGTGIILLAQSVFDYYQSWAYAWTLLPLFAGAGLYFFGVQMGDAESQTSGRHLMVWSAVAFIGFAAVFELVIFAGDRVVGRYIAPVVLIVLGALLLTGRIGRRGGGPTDAA